MQCCYLICSRCAYITPFVLNVTASAAVIRQFMAHLFYGMLPDPDLMGLCDL